MNQYSFSKISVIIYLITSIAMIPSCRGGEKQLVLKGINKIKEKLLPLQYEGERIFTSYEDKFFREYGLYFKGVNHHLGYIKSGDYKIAAYLFQTECRSCPTAILMHGYFDHTAYMKNLIEMLLERNINVLAIDLPGHGLSTGKRIAIPNFETYQQVLLDVLKNVQGKLVKPYYFFAHSTGAVALLEGLSTSTIEQKRFKKIFLYAPLVRSAKWGLSKVGHFLGKRLFKTFRRANKRCTSNQKFYEFRKKDPLQANYILLSWVDKLYAWNKKFEKRGPFENVENLYVFQGTKDTTVDGKHNVSVLKKMFPKVTIYKYKKAKHHLLNEALKYRNKVLMDTENLLD